MTQLDVLALIVVGVVVMVVIVIMIADTRHSLNRRYNTKKPGGFPEPPEPKPAPDKPEILTNKDGSFLKQEDGSLIELDTPCKKISDYKQAAMFGQEPPVIVDIDELNNCKKWLWMIATVNACDYEYQRWARMATNGEKCPHNFINKEK